MQLQVLHFAILGGLVLGRACAAADIDLYTARDNEGTAVFASQPFAGSVRIPPQNGSGARTSKRVLTHEKTLAPLIQRVSEAEGVDPALVSAVAAIESRYNPQARSPKGAQGVMQLMPATAAQHGVRDAFDVEQNLQGGTRYLKTLLATYDNNVVLALAAYNAGQGSVQRHGNRVPPFKETMLYVRQVLARMETYRIQATEGAAP